MRAFKDETQPGNCWIFADADELAERERVEARRAVAQRQVDQAAAELAKQEAKESSEQLRLRAAPAFGRKFATATEAERAAFAEYVARRELSATVNAGVDIALPSWRMTVYLPAHVQTEADALAMYPKIKDELENPPPAEVAPEPSLKSRVAEIERQLAAKG